MTLYKFLREYQKRLIWVQKFNINKRLKNITNSGSWIGVGTAIGAAIFAATNESVWIAVGVAIGAALGWRKPNNKKEKGNE